MPPFVSLTAVSDLERDVGKVSFKRGGSAKYVDSNGTDDMVGLVGSAFVSGLSGESTSKWCG